MAVARWTRSTRSHTKKLTGFRFDDHREETVTGYDIHCLMRSGRRNEGDLGWEVFLSVLILVIIIGETLLFEIMTRNICRRRRRAMFLLPFHIDFDAFQSPLNYDSTT